MCCGTDAKQTACMGGMHAIAGMGLLGATAVGLGGLLTTFALARMGLFAKALAHMPGRLSRLAKFTQHGFDKWNTGLLFSGLGLTFTGCLALTPAVCSCEGVALFVTFHIDDD